MTARPSLTRRSDCDRDRQESRSIGAPRPARDPARRQVGSRPSARASAPRAAEGALLRRLERIVEAARRRAVGVRGRVRGGEADYSHLTLRRSSRRSTRARHGGPAGSRVEDMVASQGSETRRCARQHRGAEIELVVDEGGDAENERVPDPNSAALRGQCREQRRATVSPASWKSGSAVCVEGPHERWLTRARPPRPGPARARRRRSPRGAGRAPAAGRAARLDAPRDDRQTGEASAASEGAGSVYGGTGSRDAHDGTGTGR